MTGYDTAGRIQDTYVSAHHEFGASPSFWIRYFNPSPAADLFHHDALAESRGAWDSGGAFVGFRGGLAHRLPCGPPAPAASQRPAILLARPGVFDIAQLKLLECVGELHGEL